MLKDDKSILADNRTHSWPRLPEFLRMPKKKIVFCEIEITCENETELLIAQRETTVGQLSYNVPDEQSY